MTTPTSTDTDHHPDTIATAVLTAFVGLAGLAALLRALLNATGHPTATGLALLGLAALLAATRWMRRRVRERREDTADALAGAAWRAQHLPHRAAETERDRAGVA